MDINKLRVWLTAYCSTKDSQIKATLRSELVQGGVSAESCFVLLDIFRDQDRDMMKVLTEDVWPGDAFNAQTMMQVHNSLELCCLISEFRDKLCLTYGRRV